MPRVINSYQQRLVVFLTFTVSERERERARKREREREREKERERDREIELIPQKEVSLFLIFGIPTVAPKWLSIKKI